MAKKTDQDFEVVTGFNVPDGDGEQRFEPGETVKESEFKPSVWKELLKMGAISKAEEKD